jgi:uncharacterized protein YjiS (DUF1127 family)
VNGCEGREVARANPTQIFRRSAILLGRWRRRVDDRNRLSGLSERQLFDIGLSRQDAERDISPRHQVAKDPGRAVDPSEFS